MQPGRELESYVADLYRGPRRRVESPAVVQGARAKHRIDVLVEFEVLGLTVQLAFECRDRKSPAKKEHVSAFREIISDVGASLGIMVSRSGFQRGAWDAAKHTNILLRTPEELIAAVREGRHRVSAIERAPDDMRMALASAINSLAEREKIIVTLYYFEGLTLEEIAEVSGVSPSTVSRKKAEAEWQIRQAVGPNWGRVFEDS